MAWTQSDLDALNKAIANGATEVRYADRTVKYRSLTEMLSIRTLMTDELGLASTLKSEVRKIAYSKGIT